MGLSCGSEILRKICRLFGKLAFIVLIYSRFGRWLLVIVTLIRFELIESILHGLCVVLVSMKENLLFVCGLKMKNVSFVMVKSFLCGAMSHNLTVSPGCCGFQRRVMVCLHESYWAVRNRVFRYWLKLL